LGSCTARNLLVGRFASARFLSARPPAIPARAAPPATSGVFAFDAAFTTFPPTFSPVFRTAAACGFAFEATWATFSVVAFAPFRLVDRLDRLLLAELALVERFLVELFPLFDLFVLARLRVDRLLEERVV
jgi:hypothetical protein